MLMLTLGRCLSTWSLLSNSAWSNLFPCPSSTLHSTAIFHTNNMLQKMHQRGGPPPHRGGGGSTSKLPGHGRLKGVVLKTMIRHPKKPNSGNRKCAMIRLVNGKIVTSLIPGVGHNLQEHSQVYVKGSKRRDLVGVRTDVIRGVLDCAPVRTKR